MFINGVTLEAGRVGANRRRVGRGIGSHGKTSGRGHKGESSRSGAKKYSLKEGGQMPFFRKVAKRGFASRMPKRSRSVAVVDIAKLFVLVDGVSVVDVDILKKMGVVSHEATSIRFVGNSIVNRPLKILASHVSRAASESIHKAGGAVVLV